MTDQDDQDTIQFQNMINSFLSSRDSQSPPKAQVDEASLQQAMDKNKESLKVKLMMRRPINLLVEQGIMPSPKKPLQYLQQCQRLERAKTENILKNLMKTRPDRQALIDHHILEDTTIDPSLQDKQRQLKKARLADDLNDRLSHRPGPLELVKGNILQAEEKFAQAVKEGQIPFKKTCEGQAIRHPTPCFSFEDDSGSDPALSPPQDLLDQSLGSMPSVESMVLSPYSNHGSPSNSLGELRIATTTPPASLPSPSQSADTPHKETTRRKKLKPKSQPKARTIKFHEYKGPPSAQKNQTSQSEEESSYELLLQQQQLFLQCQLEMQQKYPQVILPATQAPVDQSKQVNSVQNLAIDKIQESPSISPLSIVQNFEDLKVNGLKAELKKRNLPISGSKPQLVERLRNYLESTNSNEQKMVETNTLPINVIIDTTLVKQEPLMTVNANRSGDDNTAPTALMVYNTVPVQGQIVTSRPPSIVPMDVEMGDGDGIENGDIVKRQQQKIMQLERELERSQRQLQQQQWWQQQQHAQQQVLLTSHPAPFVHSSPATTLSTVSVLPHTQEGVVQQHLLPHITSQQFLQHANKFPNVSQDQQSALVKASLAAFIRNQHANSIQLRNGLTINQQNAQTQPYANLKPIVFCQAPAVIEKPRANSLPNGLAQQKMVWSSSVPNFSNILAPKLTVTKVEPKFFIQNETIKPQTILSYNETIKPQAKPKQEKQSKRSSRKSVKSQEVDDVLDVLISHGELPPSAAQEPSTPTTPETQKGNMVPPAFPSMSNTYSNMPVSTPNGIIHPLSNQQQQPTMHSMLSPSEPDKLPVPDNLNSGSNPGIVFDLQLDLQDLEAMDLGVLDRTDTISEQQTNKPVQDTTYSDFVDMDEDFTDFLDIITNNNCSVLNSNQTTGFKPDQTGSRMFGSNSYSNSGDPFISSGSLDGGQEALDMFSLDNIDLKMSSDSSLLGWDKIDYAT